MSDSSVTPSREEWNTFIRKCEDAKAQIGELKREKQELERENTKLKAQLQVSQAAKAYLGDDAYNRIMAAFVGKQAKLRHAARRAPPSSDLHSSALNGRLKDVRALIEEGADVNAKEDGGWTPLHNSADNGHLEVMRYLIEKGADVNAKNDDGFTPLHSSAWNGHLEVARALIEAGADVNAKTDIGSTSLHLSAEKGHLEVARALIKAGANFVGFSSEQSADLLRRIA